MRAASHYARWRLSCEDRGRLRSGPGSSQHEIPLKLRVWQPASDHPLQILRLRCSAETARRPCGRQARVAADNGCWWCQAPASGLQPAAPPEWVLLSDRTHTHSRVAVAGFGDFGAALRRQL